ncbi:MAG: peptide ABC transporter substrate-binding protein [Candidatus Eremiobacteraeota bacterium]|nr:peptide ABC transporter substrate-binding protein [Candidatus Eremiobacteraeota bacterium]
MHRRLGRALAVLLLVCASACSASPRSGGAHVLRIADTSDPNSLNPLLAHDQDTIGWDLLFAQTLVGLDSGNRLVPILIARVPTRANGDISRDGRSITYRLRDGVRFADGTVLTAADVAFTYRAILDPRNNVLSQDAYRRIESLATPNARTVVVHLRAPWNAATSVLFAHADFAFGILPSHAFSSTDVVHAQWGNLPFGTGPFHVVEWRRGDRVVFEPNPYFVPKPKLARIELKMIPSSDTAFMALQTHEVEVAVLTPDEMTRAISHSDLHIMKTPENATVWLSMQTASPPASDVAIRHGIADALDVDAMRKAYSDAYQVAGSFLPPVFSAWHDPTLRARPRNLALAASEFEAAGWHEQNGQRTKNGNRLEAVLVIFAGRAVDLRIATLVQQQLAQAGVAVAVKAFPTSVFNALDGPIRNGRFTLALDGWLGGADPEQSIVFTCSQVGVNGNNISRFCNAPFDALFRDQSTTSLESRRRDDITSIQRYVYDRLPVLPLYYETYLEAASTRVHGMRRNMLRYPVNPETWDVSP